MLTLAKCGERLIDSMICSSPVRADQVVKVAPVKFGFTIATLFR